MVGIQVWPCSYSGTVKISFQKQKPAISLCNIISLYCTFKKKICGCSWTIKLYLSLIYPVTKRISCVTWQTDSFFSKCIVYLCFVSCFCFINSVWKGPLKIWIFEAVFFFAVLWCWPSPTPITATRAVFCSQKVTISMSGKKAFLFHVRVFAGRLTPFQRIPHWNSSETISPEKLGSWKTFFYLKICKETPGLPFFMCLTT